MEAHERTKINKLLPKLLEMTDCDVMMIAELGSRGVLSFSDKAELESIRNKVERVKLMYKILQKRDNGYNILVSCLKQANQRGALKILGEDYQLLEITTEKYLGAPNSPQYIQASERVKRCLDSHEELTQRKRRLVSTQAKLIFYNVRNPTKLFTGRVKQLDLLNSAFVKVGEKAVISQNSSITGLGGIGKTELAKMFIHSIDFTSEDPQFNTIVWINAESVSSINRDFKIFAKDKLELSIMNADKGELEISTILDKIYSLLAQRKSLIIFDNAEDPDLLNEYMPRCIVAENKHTSVLITSQTSNWDTEHPIILSGLEEADAIEFVKRGLNLPPTSLEDELENQIIQLVKRLQYFPLAISQAIAFIKDRKKIKDNYGPLDYIKDLDSKTKHLLTKPLTGTGTSYKKTIYQTVELTMDKISDDPNCGTEAIQLLKLMAYMEPENITEKLFTQIFDELTLDTALILLDNFSVIQLDPAEGGKPLQVNIHRLVQEIIRLILESRMEEKNVLTLNMQLISSYLNPDTVDHSLSVWKFASKHYDLMTPFSGLHSKITQILIDLVRLNDAMSYVTGELLRVQERLTNENEQPLIIELQVRIGVVMYHQTRYEECKQHLVKILNNSTLSKSDPIILKCRQLYGGTLARFSKNEEALEIFKEIYSDMIQNENGEESTASLQVLSSTADLYSSMKKYEESVATCRKIIETAEKHQGIISYSIVVNTKCCLALATGYLGDWVVASEEYKKACEFAEKHLHPNHITLLDTRANLAVCLSRTGQLDEALEVSKKVYETYRKLYGDDYNRSLQAKMNVVGLSIAANTGDDYDDQLVSETVDVYNAFKRVYGENYYYTWHAYELVGRIFASIGRAEEARFILLKCLTSDIFLQRVSAGTLASLKYHLAISLEALGNLEESLEIQENVSSGCQQSEAETPELMLKVSEALERLKLKLSQGNLEAKLVSE